MIRTRCVTGKCPECGEVYYALKTGMIVATGCVHAWKLGPKAESAVSLCSICDGMIITDPSGQLVYWMNCTCFRDEKGSYDLETKQLHTLGLQPLAAEIAHIKSYLKKNLEINKGVAGAMAVMLKGMSLDKISDEMTIHPLPAKSYRCEMFMVCPKASAVKKSCKSKNESRDCPYFAQGEEQKPETPKTEAEEKVE